MSVAPPVREYLVTIFGESGRLERRVLAYTAEDAVTHQGRRDG